MEKRTYILLISIFVICIAMILFLAFISTSRDKLNGFERRFVTLDPLEQLDISQLSNSSYYFAGRTEHNIFLGSYVWPRTILQVNTESQDTSQITYTLSESQQFVLTAIRVAVDSPFFYLSDGTVPIIYRGRLTTRIASPIPQSRSRYFLNAISANDSIQIIKWVDSTRLSTLGLMNTKTGIVTPRKGLLEKQIDGFFCTDGKIEIDKNNVAYVYTYRNEYLITDALLATVFKGRTIDTVSRTQIRVTRLQEGNTIVLSSPPRIVNRASALIDNILLVNSNLKADNETLVNFESNSVIDVYDINKAEYKFSFYIQNYNRNRLNSISVVGSKIFALYDDALISFALPQMDFLSNGENILHVKSGIKTENLYKKVSQFCSN
jgi:hypothetical protein